MSFIPLQITLRDIEQTDTIETKIREKAEKLTKFSDQIISCHVVAEFSKKHLNHGKLFSITVNVVIPSHEFVAHKEDENLYVALRDAFKSLTRQLTDSKDKEEKATHRGAPKHITVEEKVAA